MTNLFHISRTQANNRDDYMTATLTILTQGGEQNIRFNMTLENFTRAITGERVRIDDLIIHNRDKKEG